MMKMDEVWAEPTQGLLKNRLHRRIPDASSRRSVTPPHKNVHLLTSRPLRLHQRGPIEFGAALLSRRPTMKNLQETQA